MKSERTSRRGASASRSGRIGAILFIAVSATALLGLAQGLPANATVEEAIRSRFKFSARSAGGNSTAVEAGTALVVRVPGIMSIPFGPTPIPLSTYKDGTLRPPGFMQRALTGTQPATPLSIDERVHLVNIEMNVKGDNFTLVVFGCNACNGSYSTAAVTFQFAKGYFKTAEAVPQVLRVINEVFSTESTSNEPQADSSPNLTRGTPEADRAPVLGSVYVSALDSADRLVLNSAADSFSLQEGGQSFTGTYSITGATLTLRIVELQKNVDVAIQGNRLIVGANEIWIQPLGPQEDTTPAIGASVEAASRSQLSQQGTPQALANLLTDIEAGKELSFPVKYSSGVGPGWGRTTGFISDPQSINLFFMTDGVLRVSKTVFSFRGPCLVNRGFRGLEHCDFRVSPDKILELENQPSQSSRIRLKVAVKNAKGDKEDKKDYYFYNVAASEIGDVYLGAARRSLICDGCDDSMDGLYGLLQKVRERQFQAPSNDVVSSFAGKYIRRGKSSDYIDLASDGTFHASQGGKVLDGSYKVQADTIVMQLTHGKAYTYPLVGNIISERNGTIWEKSR